MRVLIVLLFVVFFVNAQDRDVTVGNGRCGSSQTQRTPAYYSDGTWTNKDCSWTAVIYPKGKLENVGKIKTIGYYPDCASSDKDFTPAKNQKIYMKEVDDSKITDASPPDLSTFTKVYDGDITWKQRTTWTSSLNKITLDTEFDYSGEKHLMVYFENESQQQIYNSWNSFPFIWDYAGEDNVVYGTYKKGERDSSVGYIDKVIPVTYFGIGSTSCTNPKISTTTKPEICGGSYDLTNIQITDENNTNATITYHSGSPADDTNKLTNTEVSPTADTTYYILATKGNCTDELEVKVKTESVTAKIVKKN